MLLVKQFFNTNNKLGQGFGYILVVSRPVMGDENLRTFPFALVNQAQI